MCAINGHFKAVAINYVYNLYVFLAQNGILLHKNKHMKFALSDAKKYLQLRVKFFSLHNHFISQFILFAGVAIKQEVLLFITSR